MRDSLIVTVNKREERDLARKVRKGDCEAIDRDYICTRKPGHNGDHLAGIGAGEAVWRWKNEVPA